VEALRQIRGAAACLYCIGTMQPPMLDDIRAITDPLGR
jgi:hypothetical protein